MPFTEKIRQVALLTAIAFLSAGCGADKTAPSSSSSQMSRELRTVQLKDAGMVSRVATFRSVKDLSDASDLVVVATAGASSPHPVPSGRGPQPSFLDVQFTVEEVLDGEADLAVPLAVFAEGPSKFVPGAKYLLFLTRWPDRPLYAVTGYVSGMYQEVSLPGRRLAFGRVDPESPELPQGLEVTGSDMAALQPLG